MKYQFIDNTEGNKIIERYKKDNPLFNIKRDINLGLIAVHMSSGQTVEVGDMFFFRDELIIAGYELWKDFKIKKIEDE